MIDFFKSTNGRIHRLSDLEEGCWINVINPTEDELNLLISDYEVEPEFLRAALDEEESSRIESEDTSTLIILDVPVAEKKEDSLIYTTMPIGIVVTPRHVITVSLRDNPVLSELADGMVRNIHTALKTQFVMHIMLRMAQRYLQYLKQIDKISNHVEMQLRKSMKNKELIQLLELQKSLVYFSTSLKADEITMEKMMRGRYIKLYEEDQDLLEDVLIEIKQAIEMSSIYLNILSGTMDAFASVISNNRDESIDLHHHYVGHSNNYFQLLWNERGSSPCRLGRLVPYRLIGGIDRRCWLYPLSKGYVLKSLFLKGSLLHENSLEQALSDHLPLCFGSHCLCHFKLFHHCKFSLDLVWLFESTPYFESCNLGICHCLSAESLV